MADTLSTAPAGRADQAVARAAHPSQARTDRAHLAPVPSSDPPVDVAAADLGEDPVHRPSLRLVDEDGSLVTEYGLIAVVAATVAGVIIQWASGGALVTLFNALLRQARELVGA